MDCCKEHDSVSPNLNSKGSDNLNGMACPVDVKCESDSSDDDNYSLLLYVSSSDSSVEDNNFGDDWIGKPGVSSESDEDQKLDVVAVKTETKKCKNRPMPDNIEVLQGDPIKYRCVICDKSFGSKCQIRYHSYCGLPEKPFKCNLCSKSFSKKTALNYHLRTHSGERPYVCLMCDKAFLQLDKLKRHKRIHFGNNVECNECKEKFRDTYSLNVHKRIHRESDIYSFECNICRKRYKDRSTLNRHVKGVHSDSKLFFCEYCGKGFDWKNNLVCHIRTHSGLRPFSCDLCKRRFKNLNDVRKHRLTHNSSWLYRCDVCKGTFKRRDNLTRHLRNIHPEHDLTSFVKCRSEVIKKETSSLSSSSHPSRPAPDVNRISVIKNLGSSSNVNSTHTSVIKHSGQNSSNIQLSTNQLSVIAINVGEQRSSNHSSVIFHNIFSHQGRLRINSEHERECVIRSTRQ